MNSLELKVPPVLVFALALAAMLVLPTLCDNCLMDGPLLKPIAALIATCGTFISFIAARHFRHHHTTLLPMRPHEATTLVNTGLFRHSRNPMYLGMAIILSATSIWLGDLASLIYVAAFIIYLTRFQVIPEERSLLKIFGADYQAYCQRVRRWI